jgi:UDP-N-acetylglucosamine 2-epimerase
VQLVKPLGLFDYLALQKCSACVISDSGTVTEEADILGFPAVSPRLSHERPEGFDEGVIMLSNMQPDRLLSAINLQVSQYTKNRRSQTIADYMKVQPSMTVVKAIGSYVDYINRNVWGA